MADRGIVRWKNCDGLRCCGRSCVRLRCCGGVVDSRRLLSDAKPHDLLCQWE